VAAIAAGGDHTCALTTAGGVKCWGANNYGQLGDTTTTERHTPVDVSGLTSGVAAIAAGSGRTCALNTASYVMCWGYNSNGQLGDATFVQHSSPVLVVNSSVDGFLNLNSDAVIIPPPDLNVPFFVITSGAITATSASVSTTTKFNAADVGTSGAVFVTAMVPASSVGALQSLASSGQAAALTQAATADGSFVLIQLTATGWQQVLGGTLIPFASGVLGKQLSVQPILNGTNTKNLQGAQYCVGYGTSAAEMIATGRMRVVATIPTDPNATSTPTVSCIVEPSGTSTLTVTNSGSGTGAITSSPAGINCGATCSGTFASGSSVTLTATPDANSTFAGWSGACTSTGSCVVSMTAAMSVTATFALSGPFIANVSAVVTGYYETILGRSPDAAGLQYWIDEANRVVSLGADVREVFFAMSIDFFNSTEYRNRNTDNTQYLTDLYRTFFQRQPDSAGLAFWLNFLTQGMDRGSLLTNFLFSTEFSNQMTSLFGVSNPRAEINLTIDLYRGILGRLPDSAGFNFYLGRVRTAQCQGTFAVQTEINNMAAYFLSSPEYGNIDTARAPAERTPRYVGDLYNAFMRRGADLPGYQFWVGQLTSGAQTRDQVRLGFVGSPEFQNRLNQVIAAGCLP